MFTVNMTAIIKNPLSEMKGMQENESIMGVRDRQIEKLVPRDHSLTSLGKPRDAWQ